MTQILTAADYIVGGCLLLQVWLSGFVGKSLVNVILEIEFP